MTSQYPIMTSQYPIMTKQKQVFRNYSLEYSWVWRYKLGTPVFGEFLQSFSHPLKLCQVEWGASLHSYFQVSQRCSNPWSGWATQGHSETCPEVTILRCLDCVLRLVVLLEDEPSPQSKVLSALEQVFIKDLCTLLPVPAAEKHPPTAWCRRSYMP